MSFIQYCKLFGYLKKNKKQTNNSNNTRLNTSYTIYIAFILSSTNSYPSRNGAVFLLDKGVAILDLPMILLPNEIINKKYMQNMKN